MKKKMMIIFIVSMSLLVLSLLLDYLPKKGEAVNRFYDYLGVNYTIGEIREQTNTAYLEDLKVYYVVVRSKDISHLYGEEFDESDKLYAISISSKELRKTHPIPRIEPWKEFKKKIEGGKKSEKSEKNIFHHRDSNRGNNYSFYYFYDAIF